MTVMAIGGYKDNADLIAACRDLGYIADTDRVVDPTYGLGRFWTKWKPDELWATDLNPSKSPGPPQDFTRLRWLNATVDVVVLDPPYKLNGTPSHPSDKDYGVDEPSTWQGRHDLIRRGIKEAARVLKPGGHLLLKCQNQVCSGKVRWQTIEFADYADTVGLGLEDELMLVGSRPQPGGRRQVHARRNYSSLLVMKKAR